MASHAAAPAASTCAPAAAAAHRSPSRDPPLAHPPLAHTTGRGGTSGVVGRRWGAPWQQQAPVGLSRHPLLPPHPCMYSSVAMLDRLSSLAALAALLAPAVATAAAPGCLGEFQHCASSGECTLFDCDSPGPHCAAGEYRCPISNACVRGAGGYTLCPGLNGTHLDHTLGTELRVSKLIAATNLSERIGQLTNKAPPLEHLGVPAYNWLSDDEHGVRGWDSTYFPDGPGLGASFDKELLYEVGKVVGREARAKHNWLTHSTGMRDNAPNGDGITVCECDRRLWV
jgi:hypothetical protein